MNPVNGAEYWDVVDEHGVASGDRFRRGDEVWPDGRYHLVVAVCVASADGLLLMTQRSTTKDFPLAWEFPGGSAVAGETSAQAASRELREETGLDVSPEGLRFVGRYIESSALVDMYVAPAPGNPVLRLDGSEVHAAEWVLPDDADAGQMAAPWTGRLLSLWPNLLRTIDAIART
jgi:8-oxo-dGTP pyrophosphatase MutT (NUDIX family)